MATTSRIYLILFVLFVGIIQIFGKQSPGYCKCTNSEGKTVNNCFCTYKNDVHQTGPGCEPTYMPGGPKPVIDPIKAPKAELKENALAQVAKDLGFGTTLIGELVDAKEFEKKFAKWAKRLSKGLGIFGTVMGAVGGLLAPSADEILDAVNKALEELTREINTQFDNMKDYVDYSIREAQADSLTKAFGYFMGLAEGCLNKPVEERMVDCIESSGDSMTAAKSWFMQWNSKVGTEDEQPPDEVKKMEVEFQTFMNYATLRSVLLMVQIGVWGDNATVSEDAKLMACMYLDDLKSNSLSYIAYANYIYHQIQMQHTNWDSYCDSDVQDESYHWCFKGCTCNAGSWTGSCNCRYVFSDMVPNSYDCTLTGTTRLDGDCPENSGTNCVGMARDACHNCDVWQGSAERVTVDVARRMNRKFRESVLKSIENYWPPWTINRLTTFQELADQVDGKKSDIGCALVDTSAVRAKKEKQIAAAFKEISKPYRRVSSRFLEAQKKKSREPKTEL